MSLPSIEQLNNSSAEKFIESVNTLFETAPPLASRLLAARPFSSYLELIEYAHTVCLGDQLTQEEKIEVMNAHPRIGAAKKDLSASSLKEQGYQSKQEKISVQDEQVNKQLSVLNQAYEDKYGFKFVVFVAGRPRSEIIPIMQARIMADNREQELFTGMTDMILIAKDRLKKANESKI